jgi:GNAT superfamily N-acetyltransferase
MIEYKEMSMVELLEITYINDLFNQYAKESKIEAVPDYNVDKNMFQIMKDMDMIKTVVAINNKKIVGFGTILFSRMFKYSVMAATIENIFVLPEYRKGGTGIKLLRMLEEEAKIRGCYTIFMSAPINGSLDKIAVHYGYSKTNVTYAKRII